MSNGIFITGTGTDIGKTFVTALLVKKLYGAGCNTAYFKAAVSGNDRDENGSLIPGDAAFVKKISSISQPLDTMCPYIYEKAVSPHLASRIEGEPVELETVKAWYEKLSSEYDYVICEGSGGIICPIRYDDKKIMLEDIIKTLGLPTIIVADAGLGTINSVVLTCEYMKAHGLEIRGIILNNPDSAKLRLNPLPKSPKIWYNRSIRKAEKQHRKGEEENAENRDSNKQ